MPTYTCKAVDSQGKEYSETLTAANRNKAMDQIVARKLLPVSVEETKTAGGAQKRRLSLRPRRISKRDVESFTRELANLLAAGVSLSRSLNILSREASNPAAKKQWSEVRDSVSEGMSLADSLAKWPKSFPPIYIAMVRAGETGGFLDLVLGQIAQFRSREQDLKGKVKAALVYPIILAVLATMILIFLLTFFIPRFSSIFAEFGGSLPDLTRAIVAASKAITKYWLVLLIAVALLIVSLRRAAARDEGRLAIEKFLLRCPLIGLGVARFALVRFCRMLGTLVESGVPLVNSLQVAKEAIGNQTLATTVGRAIEQVQQGTSLARSLSDCPQLFPASVIEMVAVAEETGRLDKELVRLAGAYEEELDRHLRMMVALVEPALLFIMAALVGTVVIGMLLPIFNLQELIR
ncbi:MAG: type II secretion system F family protein [Sedimentisphaerales bacterium]|nr:type II secretion system F family protein [Sedimentisphaerales bacterium]